MTTRLIGIKQFRQNLTKIWKENRKKGVRFIVMHHSVPIMKVEALDGNDLLLEQLALDIAEARKQGVRGEGRTSAEVRNILGL